MNLKSNKEIPFQDIHEYCMYCRKIILDYNDYLEAGLL